jgi:hypothetical protein
MPQKRHAVKKSTAPHAVGRHAPPFCILRRPAAPPSGPAAPLTGDAGAATLKAMEHESLREHVETIREVFSYLKQFHASTFVVKIDWAVANDPVFPALVKDLAMLHEAGVRIAIVPSAKERIDEVLATYAVPYEIIKGIRVTSEKAIPFIKMAAFDVSNRIMTSLSAAGITAVIGNWVKARHRRHQRGGLPERGGRGERSR